LLINNRLKSLIKSNTRNKQVLRRITQTFNQIFKEINNYNNDYWNSFILEFYITYVSVICTLLYETLYAPFPQLIRILWSIFTTTHVLLFTFFILSASLIPKQLNYSYLLLNKLHIGKKIVINLKVDIRIFL
jgi:hypothetical protein